VESLKVIVEVEFELDNSLGEFLHEVPFEVDSSLGETLLYSPLGNDLQPFAICGFECSCRTCHVLIDPEYFDKLPEIEEDEDYLLNTSLNREKNSRLSCQIKMNESLNGMKLKIPEDF